MIEELLERGGSLPPDLRSEQAWRAVKAFRSLQPTLSSYARVLTGRKDVRVEAASQDNGSTDGTRIFMRPPMALGDNTPHDYSVCNKRGSDNLQRCTACAIREAVLVTIYHEIGHIAGHSFEATHDRAKTTAVEMAAKQSGSKWAAVVEERIRTAPKWKTADYLNLASLVNPFLPVMVNCLEDARVNTELFKVRAGLKPMFEADEIRIFERGYEVIDPVTGEAKTQFWNTAPLNSQVMIGVFCKAVGYKYSTWFHEDVVKALDDAEVTLLVSEMDDIKSIEQVYNLSFRVMARLRDLGFFATPEDPDPEPEPDDEGESGDSQEADDQDSQEQDDADSSSGEGESGDDDQSDDSMGSGSGDSNAEPEGSDDPMEGDRNESGDPSDGDSEQDDGPSGDSDPGSAGEGEGGEQSVPGVPGSAGEVGDKRDAQDDSDGSEQSPESSESDDSGADDDDAEAVDSGADDGYGGTRVLEDENKPPRPEMGTPEECVPMLQEWNGHQEKPKSTAATLGDKAVDTAVIQGVYFTTHSKNVSGVKEYVEGDLDWPTSSSRGTGGLADVDVPESVLQPALLRTRRTFSDNQRGGHQPNLKSGRVNARVLGRRAWSDDERLFAKNTPPGKKSYAVQIMMDISYSTVGRNLALEKRAVMGQAELLTRVGVPFEVLAHTGGYDYDSPDVDGHLALQIFHIKDLNEPWTDKTRDRLATIGPSSANLDGHCMEFARKRIERSTATDRIIMYYTDGKMPAENEDEELEILLREIKHCKQHNILLLGVGIRTDSPKRHGLDTVVVHTDDDLVSVIKHLSNRLSGVVNR